MNAYENGVIKYQIDLEAYKNGKADEVLALLDHANKELAKFIQRTKGVYTKARYKEIAKTLAKISKELREKTEDAIDLDGIIDYELKKERKLLETVKGDLVRMRGGEVNFLFPSTEQIKTAALFKPVVDGMTYQSYLDGLQEGLYNTWDSAVRTGYLTGQTTQQIVRNVLGEVSKVGQLANPGTMQRLRNSIWGNTRTVLQSFAEETRERVYSGNEKYFGDGKSEYKYERLGTLDNHTCLVCASLDKKLYKTLEEAQPVVSHRGCRCVLLPFFDIAGDTRASMTGQVDSKTSFGEWLETQDEKTQLDVLGRTRFEMFKKGMPIEQFVDNGKTLTLAELVDKGVLGVSGGILDKSLEEQERFANEYYLSIKNRKSKSDIQAISSNTGIDRSKIEKVREHLFEGQKHLLSDGSYSEFTPDARIALAWQRLAQGNYTQNDITLLNHEYVELTFMNKRNYNYEKAHWLANLRYPWSFKISDEWKDKSDAEIHKIVRKCLKDYL